MSDICQVCEGESHSLLVEQPPHRWVRCNECSFAWISPMLDAATAAAIQSPDMGQSYIDKYGKKFESKMRRSRRRVRKLKRRMWGNRLLDVGSNVGCLVGAGLELGLEATGVEVNPLLVDEAQQRFPAGRFLTGLFEDVDLVCESFDGVYCSEVIEHVVDTNVFLEVLRAVMAPRAILYLTTPALQEYTRGRDSMRWRHFGAPDHKLYFSASNLRHMLCKHGFGAVHFEFNFGRGLKVFAHRL